jgi:hypothetical protein
MIFTVYCGAVLYIDTHSGGARISSVLALQLLTQVSPLPVLKYISLTRSVGHYQRSNIYSSDDDAEDLAWNFFRANCCPATADSAHLRYCWLQHLLFCCSIFLLPF